MTKEHLPPNPPKWARRFLRWFCSDQVLEFIEGDLYELYFTRLKKQGKVRANLHFILGVLSACRPFALKSNGPNRSNSNHTIMFKYYFKISWRNLLKQKIYSAIKIGGFAIGIAAVLLIGLFIRDELSYDTHYKDGDRIYRIVNVFNDGGDLEKWTAFPPPVGQVLNEEFPEIEQAGRLIPFDWFEAGDNQFRPVGATTNTYEEGFVYADQALLEILEIPMVYGSQTSALSEPNTIVISKRKADKYFPDQDPVGQTIILNENESNPYMVGGVMENFPSNSHLQYDFLLTLTGKEFWQGEQTSWGSWNYSPYVKIKPGADEKALEQKLLAIRDNYMVKYMEQRGDQRASDMKKYLSFELQQVKDIHLKSEAVNDVIPHGDMKIVWLFGAIAGFILALACINFINLSTAKSANRAKEVGLQKVIGSFRENLIRQFLTESLLYSLISFIIGAFLAWLAIPFFNELSGKSLEIPWMEWWTIPLALSFIILVGVTSGLYPSFYLSGFKPIDVLKGKLSRGSKSSSLRGSLVVFQFATSIVLIICTLVTYRQMEFILNKEIGFDKEQIVTIQGANTLGEKQQPFKNELLNLSDVKHVSVSDFLPVSGTKRDQNSFWREGKRKEDKGISAQKWRVDQDYINTLGIKIIAGRNFSKAMASDTSAVIINQTMAGELGFEDPVGQRITNGFEPVFHIIGVIEDFHFESLKGDVRSLCLALGTSGSIVSVKVQSENMAATLSSIQNKWEDFMPHQPIRYTFLDQSYARMYEHVKRTGKVFTAFSVLAILVACLGLFGLSAFMVEQRSKEISIRKILGASLGSIFNLLTVNFLKLVLISILIAIPVGWYMMKQWLNDYAHRIDLTWDIFFIAGLIALLIALFTISSESIKAGLMNPADKLKSE